MLTAMIHLADYRDVVHSGMMGIVSERPDWHLQSTLSLADTERMLQLMHPDILIISDHLEPDLDIQTIISQLQPKVGSARLMVLSTTLDGACIRELRQIGVQGFLISGDRLQNHLIPAIKTVLQGRVYLSPTAQTAYHATSEPDTSRWQLDAEAQEVLRRLARGQTVPEIAAATFKSTQRIYRIRRRLRQYFGADTNEQLISRAVADGVISPH